MSRMNAVHDIRHALRLLRRKPGITAVITISLALGIGANTLMFSMVHAVLLRPLPYPDADRLVTVWFTPPDHSDQKAGINALGYLTLRDNNHVFESLGAGRLNAAFNIIGDDAPTGAGRERVPAQWFTPAMIQTLGVQPILGRWPTEEPDTGSFVISYGLWQRMFGGRKDVLGKKLRFDGGVTDIIGVAPPGFELLNPADFWLFQTDENLRTALRSPNRIFTLVGRLKPGITLEQAQSDMASLMGTLTEQMPETNRGWGVKVETLRDTYVGQARRPLLVFQGAVLFVLLIACANAAGLLLAQSSSQHKELVMRAALGSSRWAIVRLLLAQSTILAIIGGVLGLALAAFGLPLFVRLSPADLPGTNQITLDPSILAFTLAVSLATGIIFGVLPALHVSRPDVAEALRDSARGSTAGAHQHRLRSAFVVAQISLALVLLIGAGLLLNSFLRLASVNAGFRPEHLITFQIPFPRSFYTGGGNTPAGGLAVEMSPRFHEVSEQIRQHVAALPGVESAAYGVTPPLGGEAPLMRFTILGRVAAAQEQEALSAEWYPVSPEYLRTLELPLIRGREFDLHDSAGSRPVAMISAAMARQFWPDVNPIGQKIQLSILYDKPREIVGVTGDVKQNPHLSLPQPQIYIPRAQLPLQGDMSQTQAIMLTTYVVRTREDPAVVARALRRAVAQADPAEAVTRIRTVSDYAADQLRDTRQYVVLLSVFGGVAILLAVTGIFGITAHSVSQRINEIGIRMALGAASGDVLRVVLARAMRLIALGLALGIAASLALTKAIQNLLWGVTSADPATFLTVTLLLAAVALLACYLPARRALRVDPVIALRYE